MFQQQIRKSTKRLLGLKSSKDVHHYSPLPSPTTPPPPPHTHTHTHLSLPYPVPCMQHPLYALVKHTLSPKKPHPLLCYYCFKVYSSYSHWLLKRLICLFIHKYSNNSFLAARYETLTELRRGLLDGEVKGILVDTYIAGYKEGIFSGTRMRVNKIIPYSTGYGLVLSGDAIYLEHAIKDYMIKHQMIRSKLIENNVQPVKVMHNFSYLYMASEEANTDWFSRSPLVHDNFPWA